MLIPIDRQRLRGEWEYVERGLWAIIDKTSDDWIPADVYAEIRAGVSRLFALEYEGVRIGFVIFQHWPEYHAGPRVFVRAMWCEPGEAAKRRADVYDDLDQYTIEAGAVAMRQLSPRRWDADGWKLKQYVYEREV